jgi:hypothetical protein
MSRDAAASGPAADVRPKVLYVMGAGRSGTTILGVALGNCAGYVFAGELNKWLPRSGVPSYDGTGRASFWASVRESIDVDQELLGAGASCLERSSALFDVRKWPERRRIRRRYRKLAEDLYRSVARLAGATHVVDTSHYPLRAHELQHLQGVDFYLLYVARSPQGVLSSMRREDVPERSFNTAATNAYLWLTHLISVFVFLRQPRARRLFVTHEDFLADPESVLREILTWSGSSSSLPDLSALQTGRPLHGNRVVSADVVSLERKTTAPKRISLVTSVIQSPWRVIHSRLRPAARPRRVEQGALDDRLGREGAANA